MTFYENYLIYFKEESKMISKNHLMEQIERERTYLGKHDVGSEEYTSSWNRLMSMEKTLFEMEKTEQEALRKQLETERDTEIKQLEMSEEKKNKIIGHVLEGVKIGSGIVLPLVGLVWITASEKEITFTGALREYTKYLLPKK